MGRIAKVTDALSVEAKRILIDGFQNSRPSAAIAKAIDDATMERVAERTITRRRAEWAADRERRRLARERMEDLVGAMKQGGLEASEMIQALAMETLQNNPDALIEADPVKVQSLSLASEELRLKRKQLEIRERSVTVTEKKLTLLEAREQRLVAALSEDKGEQQMTDAERVRRIREIYGLAS